MTTFTTSREVNFIKYLHKWRPSHYNLYQTSNGETESRSCLLYEEENENDNHFFKRLNSTTKNAQREATKTLKQNLKEIDAYPVMTEFMTHYLKQWMKTPMDSIHNNSFPLYQYTQQLLPTLPIHSSLLQNIKD